MEITMQAPVDYQLVEKQAKLITIRLKIQVNAPSIEPQSYWSTLQTILLNNPARAEQVFYQSIQYDFAELVKICMTIVNPASNRNKALHAAMATGKMHIVKILLTDPRVKPDKEFYFNMGIGLEGPHAHAIKTFYADPTLDSVLKAHLFLMGVRQGYQEGIVLHQDPLVRVDIKTNTSLKDSYKRAIYHAVVFHTYNILEELARLEGGSSLYFIQMIAELLDQFPLVSKKTSEVLEESLREKTIKKIFLCSEFGLFPEIKKPILENLVSLTFQRP